MKIEGLIGNRGMLIEDTLEIVSELRAQVAESIVLIEVELSEFCHERRPMWIGGK